MVRQCVVGVFDSVGRADAAVAELDRVGLTNQVSLVTRSVRAEAPRYQQEAINQGDDFERSAVEGAAVGGLTGFLLAAPIVMIPGLGPMLIAGPIAAGMTGTIVGGFLSGMSGWGVHSDHLEEYEAKIRQGSSLVVVSGDPDEVAVAKRVLDESQAQETHLHATSADTRESDVS